MIKDVNKLKKKLVLGEIIYLTIYSINIKYLTI